VQLILDNDETWSLMTLVVSRMIDGADLSGVAGQADEMLKGKMGGAFSPGRG